MIATTISFSLSVVSFNIYTNLILCEWIPGIGADAQIAEKVRDAFHREETDKWDPSNRLSSYHSVSAVRPTRRVPILGRTS